MLIRYILLFVQHILLFGFVYYGLRIMIIVCLSHWVGILFVPVYLIPPFCDGFLVPGIFITFFSFLISSFLVFLVWPIRINSRLFS